jgi:hypothetical protein
VGPGRTDVSEERIASIIRVGRISDLGTMLAVTNNGSMLRRNTNYTRKEAIEWGIKEMVEGR